MSRFRSSLYRPYGAYELKATYQRHLLFGMLAACSMVLLLVAVGWALGGGEAPPKAPEGNPEGPVWTSKDWTEARDIIRTEDYVSPVDPPVIDGVMKDFNPVEDSLISYEPEPDHTPHEQPESYGPSGPFGGSGEPGDGEGEGGNGGGTGVDFRPPIDTFIKVEISAELIHSVQPEYPRLAKLAGLEGRVIIKALVGSKGSVLDAVVFGSSGHLLLDEAALAVAGKYKYKPAIQNGRPIAIWVTYKVEFELD